MRSFDSVSFSAAGLAFQGDAPAARVWRARAGDGLGLFYFETPPDIGADMNVTDDIRRFYRAAFVGAGLGLVEAETFRIDGCLAAQTIAKAPQQPSGMIYVGSITLPFRDFSYVLKIQCEEQGITGLRESAVLDALLGSGQVTFGGAGGGTLQGWAQDPYDPAATAPLLRNASEDPKYDAQFPDHPLSRARSVLRQAAFSLRLDDEVKNAPPFVFAGQTRPFSPPPTPQKSFPPPA